MEWLGKIGGIVAMVAGKPITEIPKDLFIPPDALEVLLDSFNGPLDLLLYLIRRQNIDILNIPMVLMTQQYLQYIHLMKEHRLELAADYLVMAAVLIEIKSRLLLPVTPIEDKEAAEDPRMTLIRRLQTYEQFKNAALELDELPRLERDVFQVQVASEPLELPKPHPPVELHALLEVMQQLVKKQTHLANHQISREPMCVRERMNLVLERIQTNEFINFTSLFTVAEGRMGMVVTLLAILELARQSLIVILQVNNFAPIRLQAAHHAPC